MVKSRGRPPAGDHPHRCPPVVPQVPQDVRPTACYCSGRRALGARPRPDLDHADAGMGRLVGRPGMSPGALRGPARRSQSRRLSWQSPAVQPASCARRL